MVLTVLYICIETSNQSINSSNQSVYTTTQTKFLAYKAIKEATDYGQITLASTTENPKKSSCYKYMPVPLCWLSKA